MDRNVQHFIDFLSLKSRHGIRFSIWHYSQKPEFAREFVDLPLTPTTSASLSAKCKEIFSDHADWIFSVDSIFAQGIVDKTVSELDGSAILAVALLRSALWFELTSCCS